jgi:hypothetical protein
MVAMIRIANPVTLSGGKTLAGKFLPPGNLAAAAHIESFNGSGSSEARVNLEIDPCAL